MRFSMILGEISKILVDFQKFAMILHDFQWFWGNSRDFDEFQKFANDFPRFSMISSYTDNSHVNNICTDNGYANNNHTDGILTFAIHLCSNIWPWACKLGGRYIYSHGRESSALVSSSCSIPPTWHERLRQWLPQLICFSRRWRRQQSVAWDRAF